MKPSTAATDRNPDGDDAHATEPMETIVSVPPLKITQLIHGSWAMRALSAAVELNLFAELGSEPKDSSTVASELELEPRATETMLDAMTALELLQKRDGKYSLTEDARLYLTANSDLDLSKWVKMSEQIESSWKRVAQTIRTGKPQDTLNTETKADEFYPQLTEAIFPLGYFYAQQVAKYLKVSQLPPRSRVLDLAAGAATWSIPMALENNSLRVDALDLPRTLEVTNRFVEKYSLCDRFSYISGDWLNVAWQKEKYDIVILGHILHLEGQERSKQLLRRCFEATKPGGRIMIVEFITNNERSGPAPAMVFGVYMRMLTENGCVFSDGELVKLLTDAGFEQPELMPGQMETMVTYARKPV